jgi:hypothetical protein
VTSLAATVPAVAYEATGIPAFDRSTRTLFVDGQEFHLPADQGTARLAGADSVTVNWEDQGGMRVVRWYTADREDDDS